MHYDEGLYLKSAEEIAERNLEAQTFASSERREELSAERDVGLAYNQFWWDRGQSDGRTSLIVDPPNGRLPAFAPGAEARIDARQAAVPRGRSDGPEDRSTWERCLSLGVPRLAVTALPRDMARIHDAETRKQLFLRTLLPLVLQANRELRRARGKVIAALDAQAAGRLGATDALWLQSVSEWYGAEPGNASDLLSRIDAVPPSLALAQAAQESGWGTSRFALRANALFGQRSWGDAAHGLAPKEAERDDFKVRAFPDLMSAVRSYLHNLNSHSAYQDLRDRRAKARALGVPLHAQELVRGLKNYSEEGPDYVAALSELIRSNRLQALDDLHLRPRR